MPKLTEDFSGLSPTNGDPFGDYVAPGEYAFIVSAYNDAPTKNGYEQHSFTLTISDPDSPYMGLTVRDNFVKKEGSNVAQRRLMGFLLALGLPIQAGRLAVDTQQLLGRTGRVIVRDRVLEGNDTYPARTVSNVTGYKDDSGRDPADIFGAVRAQTVTPAPAKATPVSTTTPAKETKPSPPSAPEAATVAAPAAASNGSAGNETEDIGAEVDDLFS